MGIQLTKGGTINLSKNASKGLKNLCFGVNWGMISVVKKGFFGGSSSEQISVDLDASVILYDSNKNYIEKVYFGKKESSDRSIIHTGDDLSGDSKEDDSDNEVIVANLEQINANVKYIAVVLHSFRGQNFGELPYANLRVYTGSKNNPSEVLATFKAANEPQFQNKVSMILGVAIKEFDGWKFKVIGEALNDRKLEETERTAINFL
jgi:tellurium resistance protein TerZ